MIVSYTIFCVICAVIAFILVTPFLYFCFVKKIRKPGLLLFLPALTIIFAIRSPHIIEVTDCGVYTEKRLILPKDEYKRGNHNYLINKSSHELCIEPIAYGDVEVKQEAIYCLPGKSVTYPKEINYKFTDSPDTIYIEASRPGEIRYELYCVPTNEEYLEEYNELLKKDPYNIETIYFKGSLLEEMGQTDSAYIYFNKAADIYREGLNDSHSAAYCFERIESWKEAIDVHKKYYNTEDTINVILPNLGYCYIALDSLKEARRCFDKILKSNNELLTAHLGLAIVNYKQGNYNEMKRNIEDVWEVDDKLSRSFGCITELEEDWGYYFSPKEKQLLKQVYEAYQKE